MKKGVKHTVKIMNKIGKINKKIDHIISEADVENVLAEQMS